MAVRYMYFSTSLGMMNEERNAGSYVYLG